MGNFIDMAAVLAPKARVGEYLATHKAQGPAGCVAKNPDRTLVIYEESTGNLDRIQQLSRELSATAFALHIHDDDLWLYELYSSGNRVDRFNVNPHYWQELDAPEAAQWRGNPATVVAHWPGVAASEISRYLRPWDEAEPNGEGKAYDDDQYASGDCWQVCDFLRKLGTPYPE